MSEASEAVWAWMERGEPTTAEGDPIHCDEVEEIVRARDSLRIRCEAAEEQRNALRARVAELEAERAARRPIVAGAIEALVHAADALDDDGPETRAFERGAEWMRERALEAADDVGEDFAVAGASAKASGARAVRSRIAALPLTGATESEER